MAVMIESLIGILLFTILIVSPTLKNPLASVGDYPPAIREKCMELGLIEKREQRFTRADILRKGIALLAFVFIFAVVLKQFNGADTFWKGFRDSYLIWLIIDWYDALVLDSIWFCHSKKVRIPGTRWHAKLWLQGYGAYHRSAKARHYRRAIWQTDSGPSH